MQENPTTRRRGAATWLEKRAVSVAAWLFASPWRFRMAARLGRWAQKLAPRRGNGPWVPVWTATRDFPAFPKKALRDLLP